MASRKVAPLLNRGLLRCWQQVREVSTIDTLCQEKIKSREWRMAKHEQLRKNRHDTELEKKARTNQLEISLAAVHQEWKEYTGLKHMRNNALHNQIYQDVFGRVFTPRIFPEVVYAGEWCVEQGNLLSAHCALEEPTVCLPQGLNDGFTTLVMSNPDGHLINPDMELLHWMITDIPNDGALSDGRVVVPYLPPLPPSGTGFHRYVFALYSHHHTLTLVTPTDHTHNWLEQRTFSTADFLISQSDVCPVGFSYFQSQWDSSVRDVYSNTLAHPEPVYSVIRELTPRQAKQKKIKAHRAARYSVI